MNAKPNPTGNEIQNEWRKREIGALWKRESKSSGKKYLSGTLKVNELGVETVLEVVVFPNINKKSEKSPDFVMYLSKDKENKGQPANAVAAQTGRVAQKAAQQLQKAVQQAEETDDVL